MGKRYRQFIKDLRKDSRCTVTPDDIYMETDFFDNSKPIVYSKKHFRLTLTLITTIAFIFAGISVYLIVDNIKLRNKEPEIIYIDDNFYYDDAKNGMPEEEKKRLYDTLGYFDSKPIYFIQHDKNLIFYVYYGYTKDSNNNKTYYFYYSAAFNGFLDYTKNIYINNTTICLSKDNYYGLLTTIDSTLTNDFTVTFDVETIYKTRTYVLKNCDY